SLHWTGAWSAACCWAHRQHELLVDPAWEIGGADLVWRRSVYYLHVTQSRDAPPETEPDSGTLGVDLGSINLATDSEGETFSGAKVKQARQRVAARAARLPNCLQVKLWYRSAPWKRG